MKIAVHQMCSGVSTNANARAMAEAIYQASAEGAAMYFAPEMSILIDRDRGRAASNVVAESESEAISQVAEAAKRHKIWVHLGSVPVRSEEGTKFANRSMVIDPDGIIRARYDKMHMFDVDLATGEYWRESAAYLGGGGPVAVETPMGLMGLSICYDLRFPDLYSAYVKAGVDVLAIPSAFTVPTGQAHWHILVRARAIEAQAFVIAAAQSGRHQDGRETFGHSLVVDPWGEILLDMEAGEGLGFAEIDLSRIQEVRAQIPVRTNGRNIDMAVRHF
ncbi:MAG: carbon-nitrogen hydrolase family protein [Sphingomonadaceae bacterium]|nr:carbon-nitrogen hydrolase family protein [Sphingomonadaceae bacterium]